MKLAVAAALFAVPLLAACPKPRTSAATQPSPLAFDVAKSDPKAIAVVDAGLTALGGYDNWMKVKELHFAIQYTDNGTVTAEFEHFWDRWNGRHLFIATDMATTKGKPEEVKYMEVKHDLFDKDKAPWAAYDGNELPTRGDKADRAKAATKQFQSDHYWVSIIYKVKDPGVILAIDNAEVKVGDDIPACKPSCTSVRVSFETGVGVDTWYVNYNNETHLPEIIELAKGAGRLGYLLQDWSESGGLKWPGKLQNIGLKSEVLLLQGVKVGEPDDSRYEVQVL